MVMDGRGKGKRMEDQERQRINKTPKVQHLLLLNGMKESPKLNEEQKDAIKWILDAFVIAKKEKAKRKRAVNDFMTMDVRGKSMKINKEQKTWYLSMLKEMRYSDEVDSAHRDAIRWAVDVLEGLELPGLAISILGMLYDAALDYSVAKTKVDIMNSGFAPLMELHKMVNFLEEQSYIFEKASGYVLTERGRAAYVYAFEHYASPRKMNKGLEKKKKETTAAKRKPKEKRQSKLSDKIAEWGLAHPFLMAAITGAIVGFFGAAMVKLLLLLL